MRFRLAVHRPLLHAFAFALNNQRPPSAGSSAYEWAHEHGHSWCSPRSRRLRVRRHGDGAAAWWHAAGAAWPAAPPPSARDAGDSSSAQRVARPPPRNTLGRDEFDLQWLLSTCRWPSRSAGWPRLRPQTVELSARIAKALPGPEPAAQQRAATKRSTPSPEAVRHDPDTSELHLASATWFRRRGECRRAVRVHEHLLKRADCPPGATRPARAWRGTS